MVQTRKEQEKRPSMSGYQSGAAGRSPNNGFHMKVKCPYCGKEGQAAIMGRYHFSKCKDKSK